MITSPLSLLKNDMRKKLLLSAICMMTTIVIQAQVAEYKVVFDMTSNDTVNQQSLIRQVSSIRESNAQAKIEVVIYGRGLDLVVKNGSAQEQAVSHLLSDKNISFKVCAITMKRNNVLQDRLLPGVMVVPDGIYEIVSKQQQGWGYIKVAH
jgi:intracellular sulfur oxidation DsrE/DsrF family protein